MIAEVQQGLQRHADPAKKTWWENYVKGATFRGTPMGEISKVVAAAVGDHPELSGSELKAAACELIAQPLSERGRRARSCGSGAPASWPS